MTREEIIECICPDGFCEVEFREENWSEVCKRCAEKQLAEYESEVRAEIVEKAIKLYTSELPASFCTYCNQEGCEGGMVDSIRECETIRMLKDVLNDFGELLYTALIPLPTRWKRSKEQKECCTCGNLMFSDCYGECMIGGIVNPHDTCTKWRKKNE